MRRWFVQDDQKLWHLADPRYPEDDERGPAKYGLRPPPGSWWWAMSNVLDDKTDPVCKCARRYRW